MSASRWFADDDFQYGLDLALGSVYRQAADVGEVLRTAERIPDGDADRWVDEWAATAAVAIGFAQDAQRDRRRTSALAHYRRAATYLATALYRAEHCSEPEQARELWRRQRACWDQIVDLTAPAGERLSIPYEDATLPGWFFRAPGAAVGEPRPVVIINNGSDAATSQMWVHGGAAASERGYHWMTFDGPGQQSTLAEQGMHFRPDWEAVLTPVLDHLLDRPDTDPDRVVVIGVSQGGYWVPRALAFEHRLAAAAVDPGVVDVSSSWLRPLPDAMRKQLREGERAAFDREMQMVSLFTPATAARLRFRGQPYGGNQESPFELYASIGDYRIDGEVSQITTPLLITDGQDEQFWPGQSRQLYDRLSCSKELISFGSADGSGGHCQPLAGATRDARIFDWLDRHLGPDLDYR